MVCEIFIRGPLGAGGYKKYSPHLQGDSLVGAIQASTVGLSCVIWKVKQNSSAEERRANHNCKWRVKTWRMV